MISTPLEEVLQEWFSYSVSFGLSCNVISQVLTVLLFVKLDTYSGEWMTTFRQPIYCDISWYRVLYYLLTA